MNMQYDVFLPNLFIFTHTEWFIVAWKSHHNRQKQARLDKKKKKSEHCYQELIMWQDHDWYSIFCKKKKKKRNKISVWLICFWNLNINVAPSCEVGFSMKYLQHPLTPPASERLARGLLNLVSYSTRNRVIFVFFWECCRDPNALVAAIRDNYLLSPASLHMTSFTQLLFRK